MQFINVSVYKFIDLDPNKLPELRSKLKQQALALNLKGTVLLAREGVNAFFSGRREEVEAYKTALNETFNVSDFPYKDSPSETQPFTRMIVKVKKEIISMGVPDVQPARFTGPRVKAKELKQWLDEGREVVFLDTRNDYEVALGTFEGAVKMGLQTFRQFPKKVSELPSDLKDKTVVTFCTGGIRCEKATAYMAREGFKNVYQLDGGILRYFEEVGGSYWNGSCFVFDYRVAVDPDLKRSGAVICYNCQMPVTIDEQQLASFKLNVSCPHCINGKKVPHKERIAIELTKESAST